MRDGCGASKARLSDSDFRLFRRPRSRRLILEVRGMIRRWLVTIGVIGATAVGANYAPLLFMHSNQDECTFGPISNEKCRAYLRLFSLGMLVCLLHSASASAAAPCHSADPVRLLLNGIEYRVPAALQPFYSPEQALKTEDYFPKGGSRTRRYCQSPQDGPARVDSISFPSKALVAWAREDTGRAELAGIFPIAIGRSLNPYPPVTEGGQPTPDGLFRRIDRASHFEIVSDNPIFFRAGVSAVCSRSGSQQPSNRCTIWGRLPDRSLVKLGVLDAEKPIETWPRMLRQVESFILSLTVNARWNFP